MSEEAEGTGSVPAGNGAGIDPTAVALALDGASRERADSFLIKQEGLIAAQLHHLHEQLKQIHAARLDLTSSEKAELARQP